MRFLFCDRIIEIDKKKSVVGIKTFALSEEFHNRHFKKAVLVPGVLQIEAMAQFLGWLINYSYDFEIFSIISLIQGARVSSKMRPGFAAVIHAEIIATTDKDTLGKAWIEVEGVRIAAVERMIYTHLRAPDPQALKQLFRYNTGVG